MMNIAFTFNTKPNAKGEYSVQYTMTCDNPHIRPCNGSRMYKPRAKGLDINAIRNRIANNLYAYFYSMYSDKEPSLRMNCMNPESDFLSRTELYRVRERKVGNFKKAPVNVFSPARQLDLPAPETPVQETVSPRSRIYELRQVETVNGDKVWTIVKCEKKLFTEQEAKEELFRLQMEKLNG